MTAKRIYRIVCDGPGCEVSGLADDLHEVPEGWRLISSTAHLDPDDYPIRMKAAHGRRIVEVRRYQHTSGAFEIHLCPEHLASFDEHLPRTQSQVASPGSLDTAVSIGCSCGASIRWDYDIVTTPTPGFPHLRRPHLKWWMHLPERLQGYAR